MCIYGSDDGWFWKKAVSSHLVTVAVDLSIYNCLVICICHKIFSLALVLNFQGVTESVPHAFSFDYIVDYQESGFLNTQII